MDPPFTIHVDNTTAIAFSEGSVRKSKLKHIDARQHWVEWLRSRELCKLKHVDTKSNLADFYTNLKAAALPCIVKLKGPRPLVVCTHVRPAAGPPKWRARPWRSVSRYAHLVSLPFVAESRAKRELCAFCANSNTLRCRTSGPLGAISCLNFSPQPRAPRRSRTVQAGAQWAVATWKLPAWRLQDVSRCWLGLHISALGRR